MRSKLAAPALSDAENLGQLIAVFSREKTVENLRNGMLWSCAR
jgi:hypothetical protein